MRNLVIVIALLLGTTALHAQRSREVLPTVKSLSCTFSVLATGTWKNGEAQAELKSTPFSLRFDAINTDEGTARVIGNYGPSDIIVRLSLGTLHLVQIFNEGALYTTTVFPKETRGGKLQAVHTRHEYTEVSLPGFTSRPEQYYGECEVQQ
ncbi:MAG TPA: hypothetical protein VNZ26_33405 [Vicinamibacterales bacterium]|jgi:hypothetical protein|nr:hypothetical protein [Vicinamibacterales bacterium]